MRKSSIKLKGIFILNSFDDNTVAPTGQVGFTITNSKLQIVEIDFKEDQFVLENVGEVYFDEVINFGKCKETKITALLQSAFNELIMQNPLSSSLVSFTLPFELFYVMQSPYENSLLHQDLLTEFRWEFSLLYPFANTKDFAIQYFEVEKNNIINFNSVIAIGIARKYLQLIHNFCSENNLRLRFIDNLHLASDRALSLSNSLSAKGLTLSVYLSNKTISIIFLLFGKPVYFKIITHNDASELPATLMNEINNNPLLTLNKNSINAAFIAGDEITNSIAETLSNLLNIEFIYFNPFENISPNSKLFENKNFSEKFNSFSSTAGIAYRIG
ncbi:MAG: type IV pilus biogenesis protein PilM [Ignavibacteriaceae bacterium]